jgi:hypothetical protein
MKAACSKILAFAMLTVLTVNIYAQNNLAIHKVTFEAPKDTCENFQSVDVKLGGDFALQFQALNQQADSIALIPLGSGFNLPTANLSVNTSLAKGIHLNMDLYLSARHHNETWVKGGSLTIDQLPFLDNNFVNTAMKYMTFRAGDDEINYGDAHFRRSDNGNVINNPFVGNYLMDAYMTSPFFEALFRKNQYSLLGGIGSGIVKQDLTGFKAPSTYTEYNTLDELAYYFKLAYDKQLTSDFRTRVSISGYINPKQHGGNLFGGDRTGSRYYLVMNKISNNSTDLDIKSQHLNGNLQPGSTYENNSYMFNTFLKYKGLEAFLDYDFAGGKLADKTTDFNFDQIALDVLYKFGSCEQFYVGGRYDTANDNKNEISATRIHGVLGWYMLESIILKLEYIQQRYDGTPSKTRFGKNDGFDGMVFESAISF